MLKRNVLLLITYHHIKTKILIQYNHKVKFYLSLILPTTYPIIDGDWGTCPFFKFSTHCRPLLWSKVGPYCLWLWLQHMLTKSVLGIWRWKQEKCAYIQDGTLHNFKKASSPTASFYTTEYKKINIIYKLLSLIFFKVTIYNYTSPAVWTVSTTANPRIQTSRVKFMSTWQAYQLISVRERLQAYGTILHPGF